MQFSNYFKIPTIFLRVALAITYLWFVSTRAGFLGIYVKPNEGWGDWQHFMGYARQTKSFLPDLLMPAFAVIRLFMPTLRQ